MENLGLLKNYVYLCKAVWRIVPSFARHIAHILPNYHTERIERANTNHREVAP
jgi:hypothetical protein